jgi:hypothetical protein
MATEDERAELASAVRAALERSCAGSRTRLLGSLAAGTADVYSDMDVEWIVPDASFAACVSRVGAVLRSVRPVEEMRGDPDYQHSDRRRLLFVRFEGVPLLWRLDLSVRAESVAEDADYDTDNPAARARDGEWSRPARALANAAGAVKAVARHRPDTARGLLSRGFARISEPADLTGSWPTAIERLAHAAARHDPDLVPVAERVVNLARTHLGDDPGGPVG